MTGNFPAPRGGGCQRLCHRRAARRSSPAASTGPAARTATAGPRAAPARTGRPAATGRASGRRQRPEHRQDITGRTRVPPAATPGHPPAGAAARTATRAPGPPAGRTGAASPAPSQHGTPSPAATWFHGRPRAAASSAAEITSTPYRLRRSIEPATAPRHPHARAAPAAAGPAERLPSPTRIPLDPDPTGHAVPRLQAPQQPRPRSRIEIRYDPAYGYGTGRLESASGWPVRVRQLQLEPGRPFRLPPLPDCRWTMQPGSPTVMPAPPVRTGRGSGGRSPGAPRPRSATSSRSSRPKRTLG